jgi:hypothetical protein
LPNRLSSYLMASRSFQVFLSLLSLSLAASAQHSIEINAVSGFKVFSPGNYSLSGMSHGAEAAFNISQKNQNHEWVRRLNITDISIVGGFHNMQSVQITDSVASKGFLHNLYSVSGRLSHQLFESGRVSLSLTAGIGVAYSTSSYFTDNNPIVGSRLNFSPQTGLKLKARITGSLTLASAVNLFHYSNAGLQVPNKGVNAFQGLVGVSYNLPVEAAETVRQPVADSLKSFFEFGVDAGRRGSWQSRAGNWKSGFSMQYHYPVNGIFTLKAGTEAVYYYTTFDGSGDRYQYLATSYDPFRLGVGLGSDIWLGKLAIGGSFGYYLKFNSYHPVRTYWTGGFKYYLTSGFGLQSKVYFHNSQADYMGFGILFRK